MADKKSSKGFFRETWDAFRELPIAVQVIIAFVVILMVVKLLTGLINLFRKKAQEVEISNEQQQYQQAGETLTYPKSNYKAFADQIYNAMNYMGTDTGEVERVFGKMENNLDVLELNKAWGVRDVYFWGFAYSYTLPQAVADEMDTTQINTILSSKGIDYQY